MNFVFTLLFVLLPVFAVADNETHSVPEKEVAISFSDLSRLVGEKNENIKASRIMVESSDARTGHLIRSFLPHVSASLGNEKFESTRLENQQENFWRVGAQMNLYRGGRDKFEERARESQLELSKVNSGLSSAKELKKAQDAYWEIVSVIKLIEFRTMELKQNDENIRAAARRAGAGVATNADRLQFEMNKAALEQAIAELNLDLDYAKSRLAVALGLDEHKGIKLKDDFPAISKVLPKSIENQKRLAMRAIVAREEIESARARTAGQWWQPSVDLYASYGVPSLDDEYERAVRQDKETVAGVKLNFDFGQGLNERSEARAKYLEAKALGYMRSYSTREIEAEEHELKHDMLKTASLIEEIEKTLKKAETFLSLTRAEYQRGIKNGPDLMSANRQYFELNERKVLLTRKFLEHRSALESLNSER